ncbi:hypothetical protein B7463_g11781, partial [Scytalidium lignicola]
MVYYGAVSRGCQRCRKRKIKCDQRKPGCLRCEKAKTQCPGFRDLVDIMFRDESERIIRKASKLYMENKIELPRLPAMLDTNPTSSSIPSCSSLPPSTSISRTLGQPLNEIGAHFFFANYTCNEPPLSDSYHAWLIQIYREDSTNHALRAAIKAAGMAGIANIFYAPDVASKSKEEYGRALTATKKALADPAESVADTTLLAVILLGFFELITLESWDHQRPWGTHVAGAMALLQLRGQEQFRYERGGQLFMQLRSQIMYACMQQDIAIPQTLLQISHKFATSTLGKHRKPTQAAPLGNVCFRLLYLRAGIKSGDITDPKTILEAAIEMDEELKGWRTTLGPSWYYTTIEAGDTPPGTYFEGKRHIYSNTWTAQVWNSWRTLRISVNQIILQNEIRSDAPNITYKSTALSIIPQLSTEICISASTFMGSPRSPTLILPLTLVSQEPLNPHILRCWATEQLRRISLSTGIRHASSLANTISQDLNGP